jgi:hypothetical protein
MNDSTLPFDRALITLALVLAACPGSGSDSGGGGTESSTGGSTAVSEGPVDSSSGGATAGPNCGNDICGADETCETCPGDCGPCEDPITECNDGIDNDGDGDIDLLDAACPSPDWDREFAQCNDGLDNDNDGDIDLADAQCKTPWTNRESSTCGIGFEIALLLPPIMALRRRRRRA